MFSVPASRILPCSHQQAQILSPAPDHQHIYKPLLIFPCREKRSIYKRDITVHRDSDLLCSNCIPLPGKLSPRSQLPCIQQVPAKHTQCKSYSDTPPVVTEADCPVTHSSPCSGLSGLTDNQFHMHQNLMCKFVWFQALIITVSWTATKDRN